MTTVETYLVSAIFATVINSAASALLVWITYRWRGSKVAIFNAILLTTVTAIEAYDVYNYGFFPDSWMHLTLRFVFLTTVQGIWFLSIMWTDSGAIKKVGSLALLVLIGSISISSPAQAMDGKMKCLPMSLQEGIRYQQVAESLIIREGGEVINTTYIPSYTSNGRSEWVIVFTIANEDHGVDYELPLHVILDQAGIARSLCL